MPKTIVPRILIGVAIATVIAYLFNVILTDAAKPDEYTLKGRVVGFSDDQSYIFIHHERIPGYMNEMTMPFNVKPGESLAEVKAGDPVEFVFTLQNQSSYVSSFRTIQEEELKGAITETQQSTELAGETTLLNVGDKLPDASLYDQDGQEFGFAQLEGRLVLFTFIYTECPVPDFCPLMSMNLKQVKASLPPNAAQKLTLVSISFDPENDTAPVLRAYGQRYTPDFEQWKFVSGSKSTIDDLTAQFSILTQFSGGQITHNLQTILAGPDGTILNIWSGNRWTIGEVVEAILKAQGE